MDKYSIYLDESGNTGSDFLNLTQPIFTFVGIGINHNNMARIINGVEDVKIRHNRRLDQPLHAKKINDKTRNLISKEIFDLLIKNKSNLFISISEKKFVIATYIDSDFFDPVYNSKCDNTWTHPSPEMNKRSNFLYENISDETFAVCGSAFRDGNDIKKAYELVRADIKNKKYEIDLYDILIGVEPNLDDLAEVIKTQNSSANILGASAGVLQSPNFFSFCALINKVEQLYSKIGVNNIELVFDSSIQFNRAFLNIFDKLKNAEKTTVQFKDSFPLIFGYESLDKFRYENAKSNIFLQISDIVATSIKNVVQKIYIDNGTSKYNDFETFILYFLTSYFREFGDTFCSFVIPDSLGAKMINILFDKNRISIRSK